MDDKYYVYTFSSSAELSSFVAGAILQWLLFPFRILLEALTGSPLDVIRGIDTY